MKIQHPTPKCGCFPAKHCALDVAHWLLSIGRWALDVGRWMFDVGCSTLTVGRSSCTLSPVSRKLDPSPSRSGLSLFELLTVLSILAILTGLVIGLGRHSDILAKRRQAVGELGIWHEALQRFYDNHDWGHYPTNCSGDVSNLLFYCESVGALTNHFGETMSTPLARISNDPWGQPYQYRPDTNNPAPQSYDLYSRGPNRKDSDSDDIRFQP